MTEILTTKYKTDLLRLFYNDLASNEFYVFVSSLTTDPTSRVSAANTKVSEIQFLDNVLFGKKILTSDTKFMIKYYPWQEGQVFVQYDDATDLEDQKFFAAVGPNVNDTGDYRIYKCLNNNNGKKVTSPPPFVASDADQIYETADGYVWKYMFALTQSDFEAYNAIGYIPIGGSFEVDPVAANPSNFTGSVVDQILITNTEANQGYFSVTGMNVAEAPDNAGLIICDDNSLSEIANYYAGMTLYVTDGSGESYVRKITSYSYNSIDETGEFTVVLDADNPRLPGVAKNGTAAVYPRIEVTGDGTGATAIPVINNNGTITKIRMINAGSDYTRASAEIIDPLYDFDPESEASIEVRATLRPILSPRGGHGSNPVDEFKCKHILLYGYVTEADNNAIGATGSYSQLGIIKDPDFDAVLYPTTGPNIFDNRLAIVTNDIAKAVSAGTVLQQIDVNNEVIFSATVHELDYTANTIYLDGYMGPYANQPGSDIALSELYPLTTPTGQTININTPVADNITESAYKQRTGEVYFMEDLFPLTRNNSSREEYKLVLEF